MLKLYNTLSRKIEEFKPLKAPQVGMYTCGPTVYDFMHIGNLRTLVLSDLLSRVFKYNNYEVLAVENITDIDDKIIKKARETKTSIEEVAKKYTALFIRDARRVNINLKNLKAQPRATEYIEEMIAYIKVLMEKGFAYLEKDGSVYFDISKFPKYGQLSQIEKRELKTGTRVLSDEYTKDNIQDFALWKAVSENEVGFPSLWGRGRPGWHIECSVMSQKNLGDTLDLHVGGVDLIFPHHENEIAQSEGKTGKKFVNYFIHGAHMLVDGQKMSKSLGNIHTVDDVIEKGFDPLALRYLYFQTHYRKVLNFTWGALTATQMALQNLKFKIQNLKLESGREKHKIGCAEYEREFLAAINDDLNMPQALAVVWKMLDDKRLPNMAKLTSLLKFDEVLGLDLGDGSKETKETEMPEEIMKLIKEREQLRKQGRYHLADQLRNKIKKLGFLVEDKNGASEIREIDR